MTARLPVELEIDFRHFARTPPSPQEFLSFWDELSKYLVGKPLRAGATHEIEHPRDGILRLTVISLPQEVSLIGQDTHFAIHSILEQPKLKNFCARCRALGKSVRGTYACVTCQQARQPDRICEDHVVILSGGMRLDGHPLATCDLHVPDCKCGQRASFWCDGPQCRRRAAWCEQHRKQHPNAPEIIYCPDCYSEVFPVCARPGCTLTATSICEYIKAEGNSCSRRMCSKDVVRWQIYGPHKIGLGLCNQHRQINALSDEQILYQVVAATAMRKLSNPRSRHDLPSLQSIHHILLKPRNKAYGIQAINQMFVTLSAGIGHDNRLEQMMSELLEYHEKYRQANLERDAAEKQLGLPFFEKLKTELRRRGWNEMAEQLVFSDYRPKANVIYIRLPEHLRGRFAGTKHRTVNQLGELIGARIDFERGE
jgi:hypothetical protein